VFRADEYDSPGRFLQAVNQHLGKSEGGGHGFAETGLGVVA
jgi:hypothetical protein